MAVEMVGHLATDAAVRMVMSGLTLALTIVGTIATVTGVVWAIAHQRKASKSITLAPVIVTWRACTEMKNRQGTPVAIVGMESELALRMKNSSTREGVRLEIQQPKPVSGVQYKSILQERKVLLQPGESKDICFRIIPKIEGRLNMPAPVIRQVGYQSKSKVALPETKPLELVIEKPSPPLLEARRTITSTKAKVQEVVGLNYHLRNDGNGIAKAIKIAPLLSQGLDTVGRETVYVVCPGHAAVTTTIYLRARNDGIMELPGHQITYEDDKGNCRYCSVPSLKLDVSFRPATHLLGRDVEMARLREAKEELRAGRGRLVIIPGEAGAGKSRLVEDFLRESQHDDFIIVKGDSAQMHQVIPYLPFKTILMQMQSGIAPPEDEMDTGNAAQVTSAGTVIDRRSAALSATSTSQQSQFDPENARALMLETFHRASRSKYLIVCLEDIHWCDSGSLDLIEFLALRLEELPILMIATYRVEALATSEQEHGPFSATLNRLRQRNLVYELAPLKPFTQEQTQQFISAAFPQHSLPPSIGDVLHEETGGNPLFLVEVLELLREKGVIHREDGKWHMTEAIGVIRDMIPSTVEAVIRLRLDCLSEEQRTELEKASIFGKQFLFSVWRDLSGRAEDDLVSLVEEYMNYQLVQEEDPHEERLTFTHAKIQEVIYAAIRELRRRRMHQKAAQVLEDRQKLGQNIDAADLAQHYYRAANHEAALPYLIQSARTNNMVNSTYEARQDLIHAEECLGKLGDKVDTALVLEFHNARGESFVNTGDYDKAKDEYEQSMVLAKKATNTGQQAWALNMLGDIERHRANYAESETLYKQCCDLAEKTGDHYLVTETVKDLGLLLYRRGVAERALSQCEAATKSFRRAERFLMDALQRCDGLEMSDKLRYGVQRQAYNYLGIIKATEGRYEEAEEYYDTCQELTTKHNLVPYVQNSYGELRRQQGRLVEAKMHYRAFLDYASGAGLKREQAIAYNNLGIVLTDQRDYNGAHRSFDHSIELSSDLGLHDLQIETLIMQGIAWARQDEHEKAMGSFRRSLRLRAEFDKSSDADEQAKLAEQGKPEEVYREIGEELLAIGDYAKARPFLEWCLARTPDDQKARRLLEACHEV